MGFIHEDFLLHSETARRLFHEYAAGEPILDYHSHLSPSDIAADRRFHNLFEIWLEGDHYKWRAMRADGVAEKYCTGDASPFDKFQAWAKPFRTRSAIRSITGLTLSSNGISELMNYWTKSPRVPSGIARINYLRKARSPLAKS